ncbi:hypothetical protein [Nakamurella aerolata]|uniref:Uncharacterized protein n=1 Tax=Nakamurella aerolata TaxID=1656892 RepID=A0A849A9T5_9ACTN|nr:hypothetical protein [Nakamurella aerolata]NNG36363.1 hypothetical protein [Nakamurella aerolata]
MDKFFTVVGVLAGWAWDAVLRLPHLYAVVALYWLGIAGFLIQRYPMRRTAASARTAVAIQLVAAVGVVIGLVDLLARRQVDFVHLSLVAYFATSIGVARMVVRGLDRRPTGLWQGFGLRARTYLTMFVVAVGFSALAGDPWWFDFPRFAGRDPIDVMNNTNWLHLGASVAGLAVGFDLLCTLCGRTPWGRKATGSPSAARSQRRAVSAPAATPPQR